MNSGDLLISLQKICVLVTITYFASRTDAFARLLLRDTRRKDQPWIFLVFSPLALGEVVLAPHNPAMDARVVSATAAGLFGGPLLGVWTGVVSWAAGSVHMPWSPLSGLPAAVAGALAGLFYRYGSPFVPTVIAGFLVGTLGHGLWLGIALPRVYLVGSWDTLVVQYMLPMLVSGLGAALFLVIIGDVRTQRERLERSELARAIALANRVLPNLRAGLDETAARHIAELVRRLTGLSAVAIAVADKLLAYVSEGEDRYRETALVPTAAIQAMRDGQRHSSDKRSGRCSALGWSSVAAVAAPLLYRGEIVASVVLFQTGTGRLREEVVDLGVEIAQLFLSLHLQTAEIASQAEAVAKAELKALQAQVHPHFLFNALNTLAGLCEVDPGQAARLAVRLGEFFRSSFRSKRELISTVAEELSTTRSYLEIEKARFGERLEVVEESDPAAEECTLPSFSIQPLVENAIVHGVSKKRGKGVVRIISRLRGEDLVLWVVDNGCGFDPKGVDWAADGSHALSMLNKRLKSLYGENYALKIRSGKDRGTIVCLRIPASINR